MGLLDFLKREEKAARLVFGKRELAIIRKQLMGEQLRQSERNRLSKFIRPKLQFIARCASFGEEFELKRRETLKNVIEKAEKIILADKKGKRAVAILLFGSHAVGDPTYRSDIDICAVFDDINRKEADEFRLRVLKHTPQIVDVQVFNTLPIWVKLGIAKNHKILFKTKEFDEDFWIQVIKIASESRVMHYVPA